MRRLFPHPWLSLVLLLIWLLLQNSVSFAQLLVGGLFAWLIPLFTRPFWPETVVVARPLLMLRFLLLVLYDIVTANITVARQILVRPRQLHPAFVVVPLSLQSELAISILTNVISLTPGTVAARLSQDHTELWVHALHVEDTEALVAEIKQRYEAPLKEVLEPC